MSKGKAKAKPKPRATKAKAKRPTAKAQRETKAKTATLASGEPSIARAPVAPAAAAPTSKLTDKRLDGALAEAAEDGDVAALAPLAAEAKARARQQALDHAILLAAAGSHLEAVEVLLAAGASANARGPYGGALSRAVLGDNAVALARVLLAAGADPNTPSVNDKTALHEAVEYASPETVRLLLEAGADPNRLDDSGMTPIHTAVERHLSTPLTDPSVIDMLVDHGGDPNAGTNHSPPLVWAAENHLPDHVARLIARGANLEARTTHDGRTAMIAAFAHGDDAMVRQLIAAGADRTATDNDGISLDAIFGAQGEDVRPIDVHYVASAERQRVEITARLAVLNYYQLASAAPFFSGDAWTQLAACGLAAGDRDPVTSAIDLVEPVDFEDVDRNGFITRTWKLDVTNVAPAFWRLIGTQLLGGVSEFTGAGVLATLRGVALAIRSSLAATGHPGSELTGDTMRAWLVDPAHPSGQLGAYTGTPLPFTFERATGAESSVAIAVRGKPSKKHSSTLHDLLTTWLALGPAWPARGASAFVVAELPNDKRPGFFPLSTFEHGATRPTHRFPYAPDVAAAALENAMRRLHAHIPLERVTFTVDEG